MKQPPQNWSAQVGESSAMVKEPPDQGRVRVAPGSNWVTKPATGQPGLRPQRSSPWTAAHRNSKAPRSTLTGVSFGPVIWNGETTSQLTWALTWVRDVGEALRILICTAGPTGTVGSSQVSPPVGVTVVVGGSSLVSPVSPVSPVSLVSPVPPVSPVSPVPPLSESVPVSAPVGSPPVFGAQAHRIREMHKPRFERMADDSTVGAREEWGQFNHGSIVAIAARRPRMGARLHTC